MTHQDTVRKLLSLAQAALIVYNEGDLDSYVGKTNEYLSQLESWQQQIAGNNPLAEGSPLADAEKNELRTLLQSLNEIHQQLMKHAVDARDHVGIEMGDLHRRATGMKKYLDVLPQRITIAGKRQG